VYNRLFTKILDSSIWLEDHATVRVWITLLASKDQDHFAKFSAIGNLARRAAVTEAECATAVAKFEAADPDSGDPDNDGRRIERVPGGWYVLNGNKYDNLATSTEARDQTRERSRKYRERHGAVTVASRSVTPRHENVTPSDTDTDTDTDIEPQVSIEDQHNTEVRTGADRARAENPPNGLAVWNPNGRAVHSPNSLAANRHLRCHPAGMAACQRGICIPAFLVQQWTSQLDPDQTSPAPTEQSVRTFIAAVLSGLPKGPIGDDPLKFWRAQWERAHGSQAPASKPKTRSDRMVESGQEVLAARQARREAKLAAGRAQ
jgi:hypothetical protein